MPTLFAHETWFVPGDDPAQDATDWSFVLDTLPIALLVAAVVVMFAVRLIARVWPGVDIGFLARMVPFMPFVVRIHLGISLFGLVSLGSYLSPAMPLDKDVLGAALGAIMVVVAVLMIAGWHTRAAAWLLIVAGPIGMLEYGVWPVLHRIDLLGLALCILVWGPGRWSADHETGRVREPSLVRDAQAIWILRMTVGAALIIVAFAEKLANPELARAFLDLHPNFNIPKLIGLPLGTDSFILMAGLIEVLFGLLVISGALPQVGVVAIGIPFNATLWFFGAPELLGHLPIYGAMLVLLCYGSSPQLRPAVSAWWPWGRRPDELRGAAAGATQSSE